ncbi:MAG: ABC transporter substrate-binding protein [Holophaga sp.]|nr:ABC transporter substrate-binding protein [Holophaga sp.]
MATPLSKLSLSLAGSTLLCLLSYSSLGAAEKVLKIGNLSAETGTEAYIGQTAEPALADYVEKLNASGGINGYKIKLINYDGRQDVAENVSCAKRLISQDQAIAVIGPTFSAAGIPIAKIADDAKVPFVSNLATNYNVTVDESGRVHPYMFRVCFIDPYQGYALADFAYKRLGKRKVAFLTEISSPYTVGVHKFFEAQFKKLGGQIVASESYNGGDTEFRAQLTNIKTRNPDVLVMASATYKDAGLAAQQMKALNLKVPMMMGDGCFVDDLLPMAGRQMEGFYLSAPTFTGAPQFAKFNAEFKAKHNLNASEYSYFTLDAFMLIEHGIRESMKKNGGVPTREGVRNAIDGAQGVKVFTSVLNMDRTNHNPKNKPVYMLQIKNSKWTLDETFAPK